MAAALRLFLGFDPPNFRRAFGYAALARAS
jgi:hypothetical protein